MGDNRTAERDNHNTLIGVMGRWLVGYGRLLILAVDIVIVAAMTVLVAFTTYMIGLDLVETWVSRRATLAELQVTINDIFTLIVFVEIVRSVIVGRRRPEMYLVGIAEVGFVIVIRETIASVLLGTHMDLLYSTVGSLLMALVLLVLYKWILPHKKNEHIIHDTTGR